MAEDSVRPAQAQGGLKDGSKAPKAKHRAGMSRRTFAIGMGGAAALMALGCADFAPARALVRPPGGQDEAALAAACIRCERCYEVCPRSVIRPAHIEDGIVGLRTPQMTFDDDYCDFCEEENGGFPLCAQACPTQALQRGHGQDAVLGVARINTDWCLAYHMADCCFCYDACPYDAMVLEESRHPVVVAQKCNGCGACESVCVSLKEGSISAGATSRAIVVVPLAEQGEQ